MTLPETRRTRGKPLKMTPEKTSGAPIMAGQHRRRSAPRRPASNYRVFAGLQLVSVMNLDTQIEHTVWESLALANAMTAMATSRFYTWHSVGALGVIELTAPDRSAHTAKALRRIGLSGSERRYFDLHAVLDVKHSREWNEEAIRPLVAEDPKRATAMAEGALIRLRCGARCFDRYRAHFGIA